MARRRAHGQPPDAHRLRHLPSWARCWLPSSGGCWRASWPRSGSAFDMFDGAVARVTGTDQQARRVHGQHLRPLGRGRRLPRHRHRLLRGPASTPGAWLAAAAMGSAFMVSYARARAESLGFAPGKGMAAVGPRTARGARRHPGHRPRRRRPHRGRRARARPGETILGGALLGSSRSSRPSPSSNGSCSYRQASQPRRSIVMSSNGRASSSNGHGDGQAGTRANPRRHRGRRQLRQQPGPGPLLLRERRGR